MVYITLISILKIFIINLVLSADNAMVIAMACRKLPEKTQKNGIILGTSGAIFFRVILTIFAALLLKLPYLQIFCGIMLLWIGAKLLVDEKETHNIKSSNNLIGAIKVIILADFIMSLDNILGVAAAAKGNFSLIIIGLLLSIPLVILGSKLIINLIKRFPFIVYIGAAVIGYTAGDILISDPILNALIIKMNWLPHLLPIVFVPLVLYIGHMLNFSQSQKCSKIIREEGEN